MRKAFLRRQGWISCLVLVGVGVFAGCGQSGNTAIAAEQSAQSPIDDYVSAWGPEIGGSLPMLEAPDQAGVVRSLANLSGESGLLLLLNRSADW
jgi:hypothetical protein